MKVDYDVLNKLKNLSTQELDSLIKKAGDIMNIEKNVGNAGRKKVKEHGQQ